MGDSSAARERLWAALLLSAAVAFLYGPLLTAPVVNEDLSHVQGLGLFALPPGAFLRAVTSQQYFYWAQERTYQPLVTLFHYLTHAHPLFYRVVGLLLHALNAFLVYLLGRLLTRRNSSSLLAALLFALFPCQTEAVNASAFKGHLLALTFALSCLLFWAEALSRPPGREKAPLAAASLFFALGLLSKESAILILALLALYTACFEAGQLRRAASWVAAPAVLALAYLWLRFFWLKPPPVFPHPARYSSLASLGWDLKMFLWPHPLCLERSRPAGPAVLLLPTAFLAAFAAWRRSPLRLFCLAWMLLWLLPTLHLISFANVTPVADRYLYAATAGFCLLLASLWAEGRARYILYALLPAWGGGTALRNGLYRSPRALWEQTALCAPENPRAHYVLALTCLREDDPAAAKNALERVLSLVPSPGAHTLLGDIARNEGRDGEARRRYAEARRLQPDWDAVYPEELKFMKTPAATPRP